MRIDLTRNELCRLSNSQLNRLIYWQLSLGSTASIFIAEPDPMKKFRVLATGSPTYLDLTDRFVGVRFYFKFILLWVNLKIFKLIQNRHRNKNYFRIKFFNTLLLQKKRQLHTFLSKCSFKKFEIS